MVSGCGDIALAVEAVQAGALDFVQKPFRADQLRNVVEKAFALVEEAQRSRSQVLNTPTFGEGLHRSSAA